MPIQKISDMPSHISCGQYTIGGHPADITKCNTGTLNTFDDSASAQSVNLDFGTVTRVTSAGSEIVYYPTSNSDADRWAALQAAVAALQAGETLILSQNKVYESDEPLVVAKDNVRFIGNGSTIKRKAGVETDRVITFSGTNVYVCDLEVDGNGDNVTLTTKRGEGIRTFSGTVTLDRVYAHDAPVGIAANNFEIGGTYVKMINCRADNPGWSNCRILAFDADILNFESRVTTYKAGSKSRFFDMDSQNHGIVRIRGGRWITDQSYEINANFDPGPGNHCDEFIVEDVIMKFGDNHQDDTADSFIKVDEITNVTFRNIRHSHGGTTETFLNIAADVEGKVELVNVHSTGTIRFGSNTATIYTDKLIIRDCIFGSDAVASLHGIDNCAQCRTIDIDGVEFINIVGGGTQGSGLKTVFQNNGVTSDHTFLLDNAHIDINFTEIGTLFRVIPILGYVGIGKLTRETNGGSGIILSGTPAQRLMGSVKIGDLNTAYLQWGVLRAGELFPSLGSTTWDHHVPTPVDPGGASGDWFGGAITARDGARIINLNYGNGGNGYPQQFVKTAGGNFVDN